MKTATILIAVVLLALMAGACLAGDISSTIADKLSLGVINVQSLQGRGNTTAFAGSWKLASLNPVDFNIDVLLVPDYQTLMRFGAGGSVLIKGKAVNLKLGVGILDGFVAYLGLPLLGAESASNNLTNTRQSEIDLSTCGVQYRYSMRF